MKREYKKGYKDYYVVLYTKQDELPAALIEGPNELMKFLGAKNEAAASSSLCHYFRGDSDFLRDTQGNYYTAMKFSI